MCGLSCHAHDEFDNAFQRILQLVNQYKFYSLNLIYEDLYNSLDFFRKEKFISLLYVDLLSDARKCGFFDKAVNDYVGMFQRAQTLSESPGQGPSVSVDDMGKVEGLLTSLLDHKRTTFRLAPFTNPNFVSAQIRKPVFVGFFNRHAFYYARSHMQRAPSFESSSTCGSCDFDDVD